MPFRFTESFPVVYTQYFDEATDRPLLASPGGVYEMRPAGNLNVPVPPQDGRWEAVAAGVPPAVPAGAPVPASVSPPPAPEPEQPPAEPEAGPAGPQPAGTAGAAATEPS